MKIPAPDQSSSVVYTYCTRSTALNLLLPRLGELADIMWFFLRLYSFKKKNKALAKLEAGTTASRTLISLQKSIFSISLQTSPCLSSSLALGQLHPQVMGSAQPLLPHLITRVGRGEKKINPASAKRFWSCLGVVHAAGPLLPSILVAGSCLRAQSRDTPGEHGAFAACPAACPPAAQRPPVAPPVPDPP